MPTPMPTLMPIPITRCRCQDFQMAELVLSFKNRIIQILMQKAVKILEFLRSAD